MPKTGRPSNQEVQRTFIKFSKIGKKSDFGRCSLCGWERAWHSTDLQKHLNECEKYLIRKSETPSTEGTMKQVVQSRIVPIGLPSSRAIRRAIAYACYMQNLPFNAFDKGKPLRIAFEIGNPAFKSFPSKQELATTLLFEQYEATKAEIDKILKNKSYINIVADESDNISKHRIQNFSANIFAYGAFFIASDVIQTERKDAESIAAWLRQQCIDLVGDSEHI